MAHLARYKMTSVRALGAHFARIEGKDGEYVCFKNRDIDSSRTHLNYNLAPARGLSHQDFVKKRMSEVEHVKRDNLNVMCAWVLTLPKGFPDENEFFLESYNFLANRYGEENVISAFVHKDEAQPHLHFAFVPVKDNRLTASKVIDYDELVNFHPQLKAYLEEKLQQEVLVLNGATAGGNRTVAEMKAERDTIRAKEVSEKAELFIKETIEEINNLQKQKNELQAELNTLQGKILTKKEINELNATRSISGGIKDISFKEYSEVVNTAQYVKEVKLENSVLREQLDEARSNVRIVEDKLNRALNERPSFDVAAENAALKAKLANMENRLYKLSDKMPEKYQKAVENIINNRGPFDYHYSKRTDISLHSV